MAKASKGGNKKTSKVKQPKRVRYATSRRYLFNALRKLEKHCKHNPEDKVSVAALEKLRAEIKGEKNDTR